MARRSQALAPLKSMMDTCMHAAAQRVAAARWRRRADVLGVCGGDQVGACALRTAEDPRPWPTCMSWGGAHCTRRYCMPMRPKPGLASLAKASACTQRRDGPSSRSMANCPYTERDNRGASSRGTHHHPLGGTWTSMWLASHWGQESVIWTITDSGWPAESVLHTPAGEGEVGGGWRGVLEQG